MKKFRFFVGLAYDVVRLVVAVLSAFHLIQMIMGSAINYAGHDVFQS
jgi:hypothetical protein